MSEKIEKSLLELDFAALTSRKYTPSPAAWEDQVFYFLLVDRFSDGNERGGYRDNDGRPALSGTTPLYAPENAKRIDYKDWIRAGSGWQGGTIKGLKSKLGYLRRLGISALWVSPVFRQVAFEATYHGYGIQNFLDVDPHFGTREELRDFVQAAHDQGIYIILDIVAHHTGNVFAYHPDRYVVDGTGGGPPDFDPRWDGNPYAVRGFNDRNGEPTIAWHPANRAGLEASWPDGAIWPREFQNIAKFRCRGHITNWDYYPEYVEADMFSLKTLDLWAEQEEQTRQFSSALACLILTYCFWMAYADIDGFRLDAAKHMGTQALRAFCDSIREFAESIGKERFLLVGEIGGGREKAWEIVQQTGLDAALGIDDVPGKLERMVCGQGNPEDYFSVFQNWILDDTGQHRWYRNKVVTLVDDHDQVRKGGSKIRFCGNQQFCDLAFNVVATQLTTMGIPCIYYGTEQEFDSGGRSSDSDLVLRESMFGGNFGGKCTSGHHFFNESGALYEALSKLVDLRKQLLPFRRGRQMVHEISGDGINFGFPRMMDGRMLSIVAWSRIFVDQEVLVAFSTNHEQPLTAYSTVASRFRSEGDRLKLIFWHAPRPETAPPTELLVENRGGVLAVHLTLPPAGFVIYQAPPGRQSVGSRRNVVNLLQRT